ncbi:SycD/LcrH family type III secretion system chaperone [Halodesulfovibrio sp.]|uniref:SycD/LcrH family type III secretion system chaperone n=1 Tax=Halodesulfovibrio sp. TaxID=1912772 RepID=UPI0025C5FE1E|nr:SycD/LcrH family type III secretion system chaperone [Halodesulfovibrio sp.]
MTVEQDATLFDKNIAELASRAARGEVIVKEELGITEQEMEAMYAVAYNLFQNKKYDDAIKSFSLLAMFNPMEYKYIFGIGSCFHMKGEYAVASMYYVMASALDEEQAAPFLHTAECMLAIKDEEGARDSLNIAISKAKGNKQFAPIQQRAEVMLTNMSA